MLLHRNRDGGKGSNKGYFGRAAFQSAALFLIALTILTPLESAFAQSSTDASATTSSGTPPSTDSSTVTTPASVTAPDTTGSPSNPTPVTPPQSTVTTNADNSTNQKGQAAPSFPQGSRCKR